MMIAFMRFVRIIAFVCNEIQFQILNRNFSINLMHCLTSRIHFLEQEFRIQITFLQMTPIFNLKCSTELFAHCISAIRLMSIQQIFCI